MWIKSIAIRGFRSFRDRTEVEFDPNHNVVIGKNGSGKSSLLMAVYYILQPKTRKQIRDLKLFHEVSLDTSPARFPSAEIEIVFNDEGHRFPTIGTDIVKVKWVMGNKKDSIFLNEKGITLEHWDNMLKAAGFLRGNCFVIHQGETFRMAMCSPRDRLALLEAFAGVSEHQKNHSKSLKNLDSSRKDVSEIEEALDEIDAEIKSVAEQTEELAKYQELDQKKRAISHVLNNKTRQKIEEKLRTLRLKNDANKKEIDDITSDLKLKLADKKILASQQQNVEISLISKREVRAAYQDDLNGRTSELEALEMNIESAFNEQEDLRKNHSLIEKDLQKMEIETKELQTRIEDSDANLSQIQERFDEIQNNVNEKQRQIDHFNGRAGRQQLHQDPIQRKKSIKKSITDLDTKSRELRTGIQQLEMEKEKMELEKATLETESVENEEELDAIRQQRNQLKSGELLNCQKECNTLNAEGKLLQTDVIGAQEAVTSTNLAQMSAWSKLRSKFGEKMRHLMDSIVGAEKIIDHVKNNPEERWIVTGYKGVLASHIECRSKLELPISVAIGNKIFYHIVESANVANRILYWKKHLDISGEFNFIPLDKIYVEDFEYPTSKIATPLLGKIQYPEELEPAFRWAFSRKMLIKSLDYVEEIRPYGVSVVTPDGDQRSGKGFLVGGYYEHKASKLTMYKEFVKAKEDHAEAFEQLKLLEEKRRMLHDELTKSLEAKNKLEAKELTQRKNIDMATSDLKLKSLRLNIIQKHLRQLSDQLKMKKSTLIDYEEQAKELKKEISSDNEDYSQELRENQPKAIKELETLKKDLNKAFTKKMKAENQRNLLKNQLDEKMKHKFSVMEKLNSLSPEGDHVGLATLSRSDEKKTLQQAIRKLKEALETIDTEIGELHQNDDSLKQDQEELAHEIEELEKQHSETSTKIANAMVEEKNLKDRLGECDEQFTQYGIPDNVRMYENFTTDKCLREIKVINKKLSKFGKVNMKAIDIHNELVENQKNFTRKLKDCKEALDDTSNLCEQLDDVKLRKVDFTFSQVSKYFKEIFQILVPNGFGKLTFEHKDPEQSSPGDNDGRPVSISIKVSFNSGAEIKELSLLSGGQKTVVALAYTFALQKCDPSPIYIFDEIDANLDAQTRKRVAEWMVQRKSGGNSEQKPPQYIATSFRRELVEVADKVIGVAMIHNASRTKYLTKDQAVEFITDTNDQ